MYRAASAVVAESITVVAVVPLAGCHRISIRVPKLVVVIFTFYYFCCKHQ
jgi:hypothetical protein